MAARKKKVASARKPSTRAKRKVTKVAPPSGKEETAETDATEKTNRAQAASPDHESSGWDGSSRRFRRPEPERTQPWRDGRGPADDDSWRRGPDDHWSDPRNPIEEGVARAADLGYRVIEEQIERGRRLADELGMGWGTGPTRHRYRRPVGRGSYPALDPLSLVVDFVASALDSLSRLQAHRYGARWPGEPETDDPYDPYGSGTRSSGGSAPPSTHGLGPDGWGSAWGDSAHEPERTEIRVEMNSSRPTQVTIDLDETEGPLETNGLYSRHVGEAAIEDVVLERSPTAPLTIRIGVGDSLPADLYTGVIFDPETEEAVGTITLRIMES